MRSLGSLLLPESITSSDLASQVAHLEQALRLHGAALHIALNAQNPTVDSVRQALQDDHELAGAGSSAAAAVASSSSADSAAPTASAINEALRSRNHKDLDAFLRGLDLETTAGITRAIGEAFNGTMLLPVRVLFNTTPLGDPLAKRDEALARLNDLRTHMTSFLESSIKMDPVTGSERPSLKYYRLTDDGGKPTLFASAFLELSLDTVPWIDAPSGLLGYQQRLNSNQRAASLPAADHYCIPAVMEDLAEFAQIPFSAIGMSTVVDAADGYSMASFCRFYAKHLKLAGRQETREDQLRWLEASTTHWHAAMALAGSTLKALIFSSNVASLNLATFERPRRPGAPAASPAFVTAARPLIRADCPPVQALLKMQTALETVKSLKASTDIYGSGGSSGDAVAYEDVQLPRLSSLKRAASGVAQLRNNKQRATSPQPPPRPRPKADDARGQQPPSPRDQQQGRALPGSHVDTWRYLNGGKILIVSGRAWNIPALARHLGVGITALCWPYVLCLASSDEARATRCDAYGKPNHGAHGQGKHVALDLSQLDSFWRLATEEEKKGLKSLSRAPGKGKGRAQQPSRGRGRSQARRPPQGRGRGRGRGGHIEGDDEEPYYDDDLFEDVEDLDGIYDDFDEEDAEYGAQFLALTQRGAGRQGDDQSPPLASSSVGAPTHRFVLLGKDLGSFRVGRADTPAPIDALPSPRAPASAATQHNLLHSPMRTLAAHVLNEGRLLIDEGGRGQCGPNTLAFQIGLLDSVLHFGAPDGPTLRAACCKHILQRSVQLRVTSITDEYGMPMMLGPLVINTMLHWPHGATDLETSVENWCALISKPETWTDIAFLQIVSDMCQVAIHVTGVSDLSEIVPDMLLLLPCDQKPPKALLRVGYWLDRHLVAIVDLAKEKGAAPADLPDGGPDDALATAIARSSLLPLVATDSEARQLSAALAFSELTYEDDALRRAAPPTIDAVERSEELHLSAALSNSEASLEEDELRRAIRLSTAAAESESERHIAAVEIQIALEASIRDEPHAAQQSANDPLGGWRDETAVSTALDVLTRESRTHCDENLAADARWADGTDDESQTAIILSQRTPRPPGSPPVAQSEMEPPTPACLESDGLVGEDARACAGSPGESGSEDECGEFSAPVNGQFDAPQQLQDLLRELGIAAAPPPAPETPPSAIQTRVRRVGFAELVDHSRPPGDPTLVMSRTFTQPDELATFIFATGSPPTELIGFEFSGAMLLARRALGVIAITADVRPAEHDGLHYLGCVQDIVDLRVWDRVYMFPPCFQHLIGDSECLQYKLQDGRAFWAGALVLWCICIASAHAVAVEQPNTLLHHVLDVSTYAGVVVLETSTAALGDVDRKFLRLTMRNFSPPTCSEYDPPPLPRPHHQRYRDPDLRDRARSSWRRFPMSSSALAGLETIDDTVVPLSYSRVIHDFAIRWHAAGLLVPADYLSPDGRPSTAEGRRYQSRRGPGDGRLVDAVSPRDVDQRAIAGGLLSHLVFHHDEATPRTPSNVLLHPTTTFLGHCVGAGEWLHQSPPPTADLEDILDQPEAPLISLPAPEQESSPEHPAVSYVDLRCATEATACVLFISVLVQPLVLAHTNGFTVHGMIIPSATRSVAMTAMQRIVDACCTAAAYIAYMVGLYVGGARIFAAPIDFRPSAEDVCLTPAHRLARGATGAAFVWCTLGALVGTPLHDPAQRAFVSASALIRPVEQLADYPSTDGVVFKTGVSSSTSILRRPILDDPSSPKAWQTMDRLHVADQALAHAIQLAVAAGETLLEGWVEQIRPLPLEEVPDRLLNALPDYHDERLVVAPFAPVLEPLRTAWYPRPPQQPAPPPDAPACVRSVWELYSQRGRETAQGWFTRARDDMLHIRDRLDLGAPPAEISRDRPPATALGQALETEPWAQGLVWDCTFQRSDCCVVADFHAPLESHLDLAYLHDRLRHYPDQTLVANIVEGVRLDADTELQNVLVPHLSSLPFGYASVEKELRRLHGLRWYSFHSAPPFYPMYFNGQGAVPRKLEPDRFRRSTEGGGPRRPTFDASGVQAISINEASHVYHMPRHFLSDTRPVFRAWLARRGLPPARDVQVADGERASKWPKERKPTLTVVARALSLLCAAAAFSGAVAYVVGDDFKDHFNQLAMAPSELHKLGVVFLSRSAAEAREAVPTAPQDWLEGRESLNFISEKRLGFGTHGASNIAQRFSDALLDLFREAMDVAEYPHVVGAQGAERKWLQQRLELQRRKGEPCVDIRRLTADPKERLPDIPAPADVDDIPVGYVCPQLRLYASFCYTDDPLFLAVGVDRTLRLLRAWRQLTSRAGLLMAIPEKRSLGSWGLWLGVMIVGTLGLLIVPRAKLLRARETLCQTLHGVVEFHAYRSLCGLLEHLRAVVLKGRHVMHGLYRPHGPEGAARFGPNGIVEVDELMRKQLNRWLELLAQAGGVSAKRALLREQLDPAIEWFIDASSDACLADVSRAGIGGVCHGLFWYVAVPEEDRPLFAIPTLEFLGVAFNILFLYTLLMPTLTESTGKVIVNLRTDALTTSCTLPAESMSSPALVAAYQALCETTAWQELSPYLRVAHAYDHTNTGADLVSRAKWPQFYRLCAQLGVRPSWRAVPAEAAALYTAARLRSRQAPVKYTNGVEAIEFMPSYLARLSAAADSSDFPAHSRPAELPPTSVALLKRLRAGADGADLPPPLRAAPSSSLLPSAAPAPPSALVHRLRAGFVDRPWPADHPHLDASLVEGTPASSSLSARLRCDRLAPSSTAASAFALASSIQQGAAVVPMPTLATASTTSSPTRLATASRHYARVRALALTQGDDPDMSLRTSISHALLTSAETVESYLEFGVNHSTSKKDSRAWEMWEQVCDMLGTSPLRTAKDARDRPERNAHLLAVLMFYAVSVCKPRVTGRRWIKPSSALAYPLAIIRIFSRWSIPLPGYKMLKAAAAGLSRDYVRYHGPHSLSPVRSEPMKFSMVRDMCHIPVDGRTISRFSWTDTSHEVFIFRRLVRVLIVSGLRLGEIVGNGSGEITYVTLDCVAWRINGVIVRNPTLAQLNSLVSGRDAALVSPPRAKPDPWGEIHCPFPMVFTFDDHDPINAASAIRDIEKRYGLACSRRDATPLFATAEGRPYTHDYLHRLLRDVLTHLYDARIASVYSFHSFRSGLATALHAAGVEDSMIMLICRWMCPESLHVYRRMGTAEHERLIARAASVRVDTIQSANVVTVAGCERYAELMQHISAGREPQRAYAAAASGRDDDSPNAVARPPLQLASPHRGHPTPTPALPPSPRAGTSPLTTKPTVGDGVLVPSCLWPQYRCRENEGLGWSATVVSVTAVTALIRFNTATTRSGLRCADERLPWDRLHLP